MSKEAAREKFAAAIALARSKKKLPAEWIERTRVVGKASNKTFTPVLGTALLAKATNRHVDVFSLRASEGHKSYSARSLAKDVLVPCCVSEGVDIRNTGAEPLNNQPFLRAKRISVDLEVKEHAREELRHLCECLERADFLEDRTALEALAAFLRVRIEESATRGVVTVGSGVLPLLELEEALDGFLSGDPEGGKVGQAMVAAILDLLFDSVLTKRINDPSVHWPGDVGAFVDGRLVLSAEVKQRPFDPTEVLLFAKRLADHGVGRGLVAALNQRGEDLDDGALRAKALEVYKVEIAIYRSGAVLLRDAVRFSSADLPASLSRFPAQFNSRLEEIEASMARRAEWASLFGRR